MGLFIAMWFATGMIMMYVGSPQLTEAERLQGLPELRMHECCAPLDTIWKSVPGSSLSKPIRISLSVIAGRPVYRLTSSGGDKHVLFDANSAQLISEFTKEDVQVSAASYSHGDKPVYRQLVDEDLWTRGSRLNSYRPLHVVQMEDSGTLLYISSVTGEVVRDVTLLERRANFVGSWLHYLYAIRHLPNTWKNVITWLSIAGLFIVLTGSIIGILQWKFRGAYRSGAKTPYREPYMRWHHITGMFFAVLVLTWMFSGLMSVNPFKVFDSDSIPIDVLAYAGGDINVKSMQLKTTDMIKQLPENFSLRELEWITVGGRTHLIAKNGDGDVKVHAADDAPPFSTEIIIDAAGALIPGSNIVDVEMLDRYDFYYYKRAPHSLFGSLARPLPILRLKFDDPEDRLVYIDPKTGTIVASFDRATKRSRWMFQLLHSWDFPALLSLRPLWDIFMLSLLMGGFVLSATGVVIGIRHLRRNVF